MKKKVLMIDDEQAQVTVVRMRLETAGFDVISALDGEEGLRLVAEHRPDVVIVDLMIPKVDGIEFCKTVKNDPKLKHIPVVLFTASACKDLEELCQAYGFSAYLTKPYEADVLVDLVKSMTK
ncbi:MAG: response regulator [Candidatus Omnitrophica bacterium]|nr:response regulator [Candidatus Omnitrophota bacterium]